MTERAPSSEPRSVAFQFRTGGWLTLTRLRLRRMASLHPIAERGLGRRQDKDAALHQPPCDGHGMLPLFEPQSPELLQRPEARRKPWPNGYGTQSTPEQLAL